MDLVGLVAGSGFASGLSLYATILLLGLAGRFLDVATVPDDLTTTPVLVVVGVLTVVEFVADKVPWLDSTWDAIHTVVRPVGAAALGVMLVDGQPLVTDPAVAVGAEQGSGGVLGGLIAALLAAVAHGAKASTRAAVNTSPEPFSNPVVSLLEDGLVVGLVWVAIEHPTIALVVVGVLTLLAIVVIIGLWRFVRRRIRNWRRRRATSY